MSAAAAPYRPFDVVGLELEYAIVDADLRVRPLVEEAFRRLHGRPTSEVERGPVGFSNELAAHVFELKTLAPRDRLDRAEAELVEGVRYFADVLDRELGARLLPAGMHPFMRPDETELWRRAGRRIYETYARVFPIRGHGWLNVQSCHVNLPFGTERETAIVHNATACLLPYLPALAASSPVHDGRPGPCVDNRLAFYRTNQERIPAIAGRVVPEYMTTYADYRREILRPIYRELDRVDGGERLKHEWVNSRGAILRFARRAVEIRVLDVQECVKADAAIAAFTRGALRALARRIETGELALPPHDVLVDDYHAVVRDGGAATVRAPHLPGSDGGRSPEGRAARDVLLDLLGAAEAGMAESERRYLPIVERRLREGSLSERVRRRLSGWEGWPEDRTRSVIRDTYEELAGCLIRNELWEA